MAKKTTKKEHKRAARSHNKRIHKALDSENDTEDLNSQLKKLNLCTKDITGDGNCLFSKSNISKYKRALSDQYYGRDSKHKVIRQEICQYLKENEEVYKFFVEDDQSFDSHLNNMRQDGTFGGNMELAAFAKLYKVDIKVYQPGLIYVIKGVDEGEEEEEEPRQVLHIAYHDWEHYSSVRNVDGPFTGPPEIREENVEKEEQDEGKEEEVLDSKEKVVLNACPDVSIYMIRRMLKKYKGDTDKVIDRFYELRVTEKDEDIHLKERIEVDNDGNVDRLPLPEQEGKDEEKDTEERDKEEPEIENNKEKDKKATEKEKPKKMSASERKKEAKRRQKETKLLKERAKAARRVQREKEEERSTNEPQAMKELCI